MTEQEANEDGEEVEIAAIYLRHASESFVEEYLPKCKDATTDPDPTIYIDNEIKPEY
ncbi:hypothetical protein OB955_00115 [Halobacteria archaeon AArc-m2/3/4]|uniref:Uncharacterized protein n=1 Tax=Natronoglomus mannanivorans TaxID=2979990 RepID=A0ABT2Q898_9EURY|nr:hypothetical protein [Halobacteria archaeon AArc-m2/3/4]